MVNVNRAIKKVVYIPANSVYGTKNQIYSYLST